MTYSLRPRAEHDIANALDFYKEQAGLVVAERFIEEFERAVKRLIEPDFGTPTTKERRIFPLKVSCTRSYIEASKMAFEF